jgi:hypothetical protein
LHSYLPGDIFMLATEKIILIYDFRCGFFIEPWRYNLKLTPPFYQEIDPMAAEKQESLDGNKLTKENDDQRYLPRWAVSNRVLYQLENDEKTHEGSSKDISCTGACFTTPDNLPLNRTVKMKIFLSEEVTVKVEGKVMWNKSVNGGENLVGIIFHNTSHAVQDLILKHAFEIKKEDMIKYWFQGWNSKHAL